MATTSPDNIWSADNNTPASLTAITAAMATSVQEALDKRAGPFKGTSSARNSFTNQASEGTLWVDTNGEKGVYRKEGANWTKIYPVEIPAPNLIAIQAGAVLLTPQSADTVTSAQVTFEPGRFTKLPLINLTPHTVVPQNLNVGYSEPTLNGFKINMYRKTLVDTTIAWSAMQLQDQAYVT